MFDTSAPLLQFLRFLVLLGVVLTLLHVIVEDLRRFRITNRSVAILTGLFVAWILIHRDWSGLAVHAAFGGVMFAVLLGMYALRLMGGGDVKLLAVAFLWLGHEASLVFTLGMAAFTLIYVVAARMKWLPARPSDKGLRIPFGPSIAAAWIATIFIVAPL